MAAVAVIPTALKLQVPSAFVSDGTRRVVIGPIGGPSTPAPPAGATVVFYQRVHDTSAGWCYYAGPAVNQAPAGGDTTPNHTGSLNAHEIITTTR